MLEALNEHPENGDGNKPFAIVQAEHLLKAAGVASAGPLTVLPRLDHGRDWARQAEDLAYYFAKPLRQSRWQYLDTVLPPFTSQSDSYRGLYDRLVLVQLPQADLPLKTILDIVGINDYNPDVLRLRDWSRHKGKFKTPASAWSYATYVEDEDKRAERLGVAPAVTRENLTEGQRVVTHLDGIFLYVSDRGALTRHNFNLPGSEPDPNKGAKVGSDYAPALDLGDDGPDLGLGHVGGALSRYASVVAGDKIVTRELAS